VAGDGGAHQHPSPLGYYLTVSRKLDPGLPADDAWNDAATYFAWRPQPTDEPLISRARLIEQRHGLGWWDSMIVGAAQLQDCAIILTESLPDGMAYGEVIARSPFTLDAREPSSVYAAVPVLRSRHRPRGRPKRETAKV